MFPRALRLTRIAGVEVRLDPPLLVFAVLLVATFATRFTPGHGLGVGLVMATVGMLAFLGSVLAHELAHALEARYRGIHVEAITLFLFGGVTEMHAHGQGPRDELAVAAVGPYASLVCGAGFGLIATAANGLDTAWAAPVAELAGLLGWMNVALAVFNLIPGAPLDGGRVLRGVLWLVLGDRMRALRAAVRSGQVLAISLAAGGIWLLLRGPEALLAGGLAVLVAAFLFRAAQQELRHAVLDQLLTEHRVADLLDGDLLAPQIAVGPLHGAGAAGGSTAPAAASDGPSIRRGDDLHTLIDRFQGDHDRVLLVDGELVVGGLARDDVARAIATLRRRTRRGAHRAQAATSDRTAGPPAGTPDGHGAPGQAAAPDVDGASDQAGTPDEAAAPGRLTRLLRSGGYAASVALVSAASVLVPLPFVEYLPREPTSIPPLVTITGVETTELTGDTALLTVQLREQSTLPALRAVLVPSRSLLPSARVFPPGIDRQQQREQDRARFARQFEVAAAVGAQAAGIPAELVTEVVVVHVLPGSPADGVLAAGDAVLTVDGDPLVAAEELQARTRAASPGDDLMLMIRHAGVIREVTVELAAPDDGGPGGRLGIAIETAVDEFRLPFEVALAPDVRIGGPSAGMMVALTVYDLLADEDLLGGLAVMGTGSLDADGRVGPVGGVPEKTRAAAAAGADLLLVPALQLDDARAAAPPDLEVVGVTDLDEALEAVRAAAAG